MMGDLADDDMCETYRFNDFSENPMGAMPITKLLALDEKIAKIAGLKEGVDYWSKQPHLWNGTICTRCEAFEDDALTSLPCYKPPPCYSESLDLIVLVVRSIDDWRLRWIIEQKLDAILEGKDSSGYAKTGLYRLLFTVDNPALALAEALVEAVGEKDACDGVEGV